MLYYLASIGMPVNIASYFCSCTSSWLYKCVSAVWRISGWACWAIHAHTVLAGSIFRWRVTRYFGRKKRAPCVRDTRSDERGAATFSESRFLYTLSISLDSVLSYCQLSWKPRTVPRGPTIFHVVGARAACPLDAPPVNVMCFFLFFFFIIIFFFLRRKEGLLWMGR